MPRTVVNLPAQIRPPFEVFVSGVPQKEGSDYLVDGDRLIFPGRTLVKDKVSGWRWLLGAWGVGTYRQDDSIDIRYELDGRPRVAEGLEPVTDDDLATRPRPTT